MGIWTKRDSNWNKSASILENFGFVLFESKLKDKKEDTKEWDFKKELSNLIETDSPKKGDIITFNLGDQIKYAGIYLSQNKILNQQYNEPKENTEDEIISKYGSFHIDLFDIENIKIKYFRP